MKKSALLIINLILTINCYAQITFEKGYYINNSDEKIDCLIKNTDVKYNPDEFTYRLTENSESKKGTIKTIQEFGIYGKFKYSRHTVLIDFSKSNIDDLPRIKVQISKKKKFSYRS